MTTVIECRIGQSERETPSETGPIVDWRESRLGLKEETVR